MLIVCGNTLRVTEKSVLDNSFNHLNSINNLNSFDHLNSFNSSGLTAGSTTEQSNVSFRLQFLSFEQF